MKKFIKTLNILALLATALVCWGGDLPEPIISIDFEGNFDAKTQSGIIKGVPVEKPRLVPGKFGQALESSRLLGYVDYVHPHLLDHQEGTIEMWVKRNGWDPDDRHHHVFFENLDGKGWIVFYKYHDGSKILSMTGICHSDPFITGVYNSGYNHADRFVSRYIPSQDPATYQSPQRWTEEWTHLVMVWSDNGNNTYLNAWPGKDAMNKQTSYTEPYDFGTKFRLGDVPWGMESNGSTLIDRVRIYDKALTPDQIRELYYNGLYGDDVPLKEELVDVNHTGNAKEGTLCVHYCTGGAKVTSAEVSLVKPGENPDSWTPASVDNGKGEAVIPLPQPAGNYEILVRLNGEDGLLCRKIVEIPDFEWLDNTMGLERKVYAPWTPVEVIDGKSIKVWNREYKFELTALPSQILNGEVEILSHPISLKATSAGGKVNWSEPTMQIVSNDGYSAVIEGTVTATCKNDKAKVFLRTEVEFDGFCLINMRTDDLDFFTTLSLDIPMKNENAIYRHCYSTKRLGESGALPSGNGTLLSSAYIPFSWLGDNDGGLFWGCESTKYWPNGERANALQYLRTEGGKSVVFRLNIQVAGQLLPDDWDFQFMLQATPIKPMPKNWRRMRFRTWSPDMISDDPPRMNLGYYNMGPTNTVSTFGYPASDDINLVHKHIEYATKNGITLLPYIGLTGQPSFMPEWPFFKDEWFTGIIDLDPCTIDRRTGYATMNVSKRSYCDFVVWKIAQFMKEAGYTCQYHDNSFPYASTAPQSGLAYVKDGKTYGAYNILDTREINRRNRAVMEEQIPGYFSMAHMSSRVWAPILSFDDIMLFGENYRGSVDESYTDLIPLDRFRAEYMGRQWGLAPVMLVELPNNRWEEIKPTRGLFTLCQLHDVFLWIGRGNLAVQDETTETLENFGYQDAEFIPYFDKQPPATTDQPKVLVSAYKKDDGEVLLFIGNIGRQPAKTTVKVNLERLGFTGKVSAIDQVDEVQVPIEGDTLTLDVEDEGFRMIRLENFKTPEINIWG